METIIRLLFIAVVLFGAPALAASDQEPNQHPSEPEAVKSDSSTYSPDYCEFSIAFPSAPDITRKCEDDSGKRCFDQISFTHTYEMQATVNFRVICNKIDEEIYKHYSAEIMEATLKAMTDRNVIKTFDTSYRDEKGYKQAGLVGEGQVGRMSTVYIAQLWIGRHSALSVEAELMGDPNNDADTLFSDVLKSVSYAGDKKETAKEDEKAEEKKDDKEEKEDDKKDSDKKQEEKAE